MCISGGFASFTFGKGFCQGDSKTEQEKRPGFFLIQFHANNYTYIEHPLTETFLQGAAQDKQDIVKGEMVCSHS